MRKPILTLAAATMMALGAQAQDVLTFKVAGTGGTDSEFVVDDISRIAFTSDSFTITFNTAAADETFAYDDVLKMYFGTRDMSAIQNVAADADGINITYDGTMLVIDGCPARTDITVYDISGRPMMRSVADGRTEVNTAQLTAGVYIVKINSKTFKFSRL